MSSTKATYAAIRKALATLDDPFTRFLEPVQYAALRRGTAGSVTGVGLEVGFDTKPGATDNGLVVRFCLLHERKNAGQKSLLLALYLLKPCEGVQPHNSMLL